MASQINLLLLNPEIGGGFPDPPPLAQALCGRTKTHTDTLTLIGTRAPALTLGQRVYYLLF